LEDRLTAWWSLLRSLREPEPVPENDGLMALGIIYVVRLTTEVDTEVAVVKVVAVVVVVARFW
jgi:hypothetical protein